jgi:phosphoacetylglucosamine mutase
VGDAISDAMFVEAVLTIKGWTIEQWAAMYTDLPRQVVCSQDVPVCLCALHCIGGHLVDPLMLLHTCYCEPHPTTTLPACSRQTKLAVADRNVIVTTEDETRVVTPAALQSAVDALVAAVDSGRAFVRPSGTEDVVRVYAEAATPEAADRLALDVAKAAFVHAGGVGAEPSKL